MKKIYSLILTILVIPPAVFSQWSPDSTVNTPICVQPNRQDDIRAIPDGNGGAFICWQDSRSSIQFNTDIYAQHVDANGNMLWAVNGVPVCMAADGQQSPKMVSDGAGGIVICWEDFRTGSTGYPYLYAQRLDYNGIPQWQTDGVLVSIYPGIIPEMVQTTGGVIIAWSRSQDSVYLQKIKNNGQVQWTTGGINSMIPIGYWTNMVSDNTGGAVVASSQTPQAGIVAQRVNGNGILLWGQGGKIIYDGFNISLSPQPSMFATTDGNYIIAWPDDRNDPVGEGWLNIYAQKFDLNGNTVWQQGGISVFEGDRKQWDFDAVSDGNGGVIVACADYINGIGGKIYAKRLNANGDRLWWPSGIVVGQSTSSISEEHPIMLEDGSGGAFVTWAKTNGNKTLQAQHLDGSGNKLWSPNAETITNPAPYTLENLQRIATDGNCGIFVFWEDNRNDLTDVNGWYQADIYGTHVDCNTILVPVKLLSFTGSHAGNKNLLEWSTAFEQNSRSFTLEKSRNGSSFSDYRSINAAGNTSQTTRYKMFDEDPYTGTTYYRLKQTDMDGTNTYSSIVVLKNKEAIIKSIYPNPSTGIFNVELNQDVSSLEITVTDIAGRQIFHSSRKDAEAGFKQQIDLREQSKGIYFVRVAIGSNTVVEKLVKF